uniref:Uncharacterized protein n=1 Tax=Anguilla anguilla TaxID=7936 RepID=A0A0E9SXZ0_ANGAN
MRNVGTAAWCWTVSANGTCKLESKAIVPVFTPYWCGINFAEVFNWRKKSLTNNLFLPPVRSYRAQKTGVR